MHGEISNCKLSFHVGILSVSTYYIFLTLITVVFSNA